MKQMENRLNFYLPINLEKQLRRFAKEKGWKVSFVIREAIKEFLERREK